MELLIGIIGSALTTWAFAHYYYRRQSREQINPLPHIKELHEAVLELHGIAIDRKDERLQEVVKRLVLAMAVTRHRVLNDLGIVMMLLAMIKEIPRLQEISDFDILASIDTGQKRITGAADEFNGLAEVVEQVTGKTAMEIVSFDELIEDLFKDRNKLSK